MLIRPALYQDIVFNIFSEMKENEILDYQKIVSPENTSKFIQVAKDFIKLDPLPDHYLEFSDDYSLLKKKPKVSSPNPLKRELK
jgi:hypothetical protein